MREELPTARLRLGQVLMIGCLASLAPACGDGPICASDISVFITTPDNGDAMIIEDGNIGIETEVVVRSNLRATEVIELRVMDEFGQEYFFTSVMVDETGTARVPFAFLPVGRATVLARGITEQCGTGEDFIEVEVMDGSGADCFLEAFQTPRSDPDFPLPLYNAEFDQNGVFDGLQASFDVYAQAGTEVELLLTDLRTGIQTSAGARTAIDWGVASYTMTVPEGPHELIAYCTSPDGAFSAASNAISVHVDTEPPDCGLDAPTIGEDITQDMDLDGDPSNGLQLELVGTALDDDPDALPVPAPLFVVEEVRFEGTEPDENGQSSVVVTLEQPTLYFLGIEAQDRAGNFCSEIWDFWYVGGSAITVDAVTRSSVSLSWLTPGLDGSGLPATEYELRIGQDLIDEFNFDFTGEPYEIPPPGVPGELDEVTIEGLTPGTVFYAALVVKNEFGGTRFIGAVGPLELDFDTTPPFTAVAPDEGENGLGYQSAAGDFDGDGYGDLAVSAPFKSVNGLGGAGAVYVYFGGPGGLNPTPGVTIEGEAAGGQVGNGLTSIRWNDDAIDDLAIGAPFADAGQGMVSVFLGSDVWGGGTRTPSDADVLVFGSTEPGNWFVASGLGFALTGARFDDDERDDLVISAPGGGDGNGGVVVLYGGTAPASGLILLNSLQATEGDATAVVLQDPDPGSIFGSDPGPFFGHHVFPLGRTEGPADADDDVGVAYTEKNAAVVFRGRPRPVTPGVTLLSFDPARDLELQRTSSDDRSSRYGTAMGSIADINNDGVREIVVGIWRDLANIGRIEIYRGNAVGVRNASTVRLRSITPGTDLCGPSGCGLGSAIVNNAAGLVEPDVNGDGIDDLVVVGGMDVGRVRLFVWFGGSLPSGDFTTDSAHYQLSAPAPFLAGARGDSDATPITAIWAGDVNGDGLEDICWADWSAHGRDGAFQVLYDDGA